MHPLADRLEPGERRVSLVHVDDPGEDANGGKRPQPSDPQQDFLANPGPLISSIQPRREAAVFLAVLWHVRIEQEQGDTPHRNAPNAGKDGSLAGVDLDQDCVSRPIDRRHQGKLGGVEIGIRLLLPTGLVEGLVEVTLAVEQSTGDQRNPQVRGTLKMVPRQHAETSRVDGQ